MGIRKRFSEALGLTDDVEEERRRFVARVNQEIFGKIDTHDARAFAYDELFRDTCFELGVNADSIPLRYPHRFDSPLAALSTLTHGDFLETLRVLCILYDRIQYRGRKSDGQRQLSWMIERVLQQCACDIGVRWKDGFFYPSGAEELDKPLVGDVLTWLKDYPDEEKNYQAALRHYGAGDCLPDVVTNCYSAIEGIARKILGNNARLDQNEKALLAQVGLSDGWKKVLHEYVLYAHYYRHADPVRHDITPQEAEAYLYMTGLIIRLAIESKRP